MAGFENHFTVFIRLPFNRGDFVDPPPVSWSESKERELWDVISKQAKGNDIDWTGLAEKLDVTPHFLLQQAAWLYERQLSQVRAQMRKVGPRTSATSSPTPGSVAGSMMGGQAMKRGGSGGSRVPSRVQTQSKLGSTTADESAGPGTPTKSKPSLPLRNTSGLLSSQLRNTPATSSPMSRQSSKEGHTPTYGHSRRDSIQHQVSRSPAQARLESAESSDSDTYVSANTSASRITLRRPNPSATPRRALATRREKEARRASMADDDDDDDGDDDDSPPFLPFASSTEAKRRSGSQQDPSATLRGGLITASNRPPAHRRTTSERIVPTQPPAQETSQMTSSASSASSGPTPTTARPSEFTVASTTPRTRVPSTLSPRQQAALAALSPRRHPGTGREGSDTSPSMGSSFSDLDVDSITESALQDALASQLNRGNSNASSNGGNGAGVGMASRVSGISQALRSRYFDAQSQGSR